MGVGRRKESMYAPYFIRSGVVIAAPWEYPDPFTNVEYAACQPRDQIPHQMSAKTHVSPSNCKQDTTRYFDKFD